jgi:hypothetical protein
MTIKTIAAVAATALLAMPAAAKDPPPTLTKCQASLGTVAVVDGDTQGWTKFGLGSPRPLLAALANESGCFSIHDAASGKPANFLMSAVAGSQEEVDKGMEMAKSVATEALVRSGALGRVPGVGGMMGMFGGFGGKKKTIAAAIRVMSPATGMALASGSGSSQNSSVTLGGMAGVAAGMAQAGYATKDGQMLTEAFIKAFNAVVAQGGALQAGMMQVAASAPAAAPGATVAVDTSMRATPAMDGAVVRTLRAGTSLKPTGKREGKFVELADSFGTSGWVNVEDLK